MSPVLDSRLCGNRSGYRASHLWRAVLDEVEVAHGQQVECGGIVFDLEKAFNTLPRLVCLGLAQLIGLDGGTLRAWAGALGSMTRAFEVRGSLSMPIEATCGFAEGCGMSCLAMLLLDQIWHEYVKEASNLCRPMSYVDNWEILVSDPQLVSVAAEATFSLARQLDVVVDTKKTFAWGASSTFRSQLRQQGFVVRLDAADLGAHVTYSKQLRNSSLIARFVGLQDFWCKLKGAFATHSQKATVVLRAAWPRAMHAISATWVGLKHFHSLRTAFMEAVRLDRPGANAWLQLHADGFLMDPMAFAILQTFRDARDLGASSWHAQVLADLVHNGLSLPAGSVSNVLLQRLHQLKWAVCQDGSIQDTFGRFSLATVHWSELCLRFQASWHQVVSQAVLHRWDFQGFESVDAAATRKAVRTLSPYLQGICRRNLNGSTLTNEHSFHWTCNGDHRCVFCNEEDSLYHRYWCCPQSAPLRLQLDPLVVDLVPTLPRACSVRSWFLRSPLVDPWWTYLLSLPDLFPPLEVPLEGSGPLDFFTDGSCLHQDSMTFRLAAWAVCVAPVYDEKLNAGVGSSTVVAAAAIRGLVQTAFRAELTAVAAALYYGASTKRPLRIWSDCQGVIRRFTALVQGCCQCT